MHKQKLQFPQNPASFPNHSCAPILNIFLSDCQWRTYWLIGLYRIW